MLPTKELTKVERLALGLAWSYWRIEQATRPIDKKVARADFDGQCKATYYIGFGHTPTHVEMIVMETYRDVPVFVYSATNSRSRIEWEMTMATVIGAKLAENRQP